MLKNKIYWNLSYRESMRDQYIDTDTPLSKNDIELLEIEITCLKKHNFKILNVNYEMGYVVIQDTIKTGEDILKTYKTKDLVPYVNIRPNQYLSDKNGIYAPKYKIR